MYTIGRLDFDGRIHYCTTVRLCIRVPRTMDMVIVIVIVMRDR